MNDAPTWIQAISAIAQSAIALATVLLSWVLWRSAKSHATVEYTRTIQEAWNQLNGTILTNPRLAVIADQVFGIAADGISDEQRAKRYFAYYALNVLEVAYMGQKAGLVEEAYHMEAMSDILDPIISNPGIAQLLHGGGYHTTFVEFCEQRLAARSYPSKSKVLESDIQRT